MKRKDTPPRNVYIEDNEDIWLDKQDVLLMLHIGSRTLQRFRDNGQLPFSRVTKKLFYYRRSDVLALMEKHLTLIKKKETAGCKPKSGSK